MATLSRKSVPRKAGCSSSSEERIVKALDYIDEKFDGDVGEFFRQVAQRRKARPLNHVIDFDKVIVHLEQRSS